MIDKLRQLIREGEGLTVELKRCRNKITNNIYETVSAFSNRYGGYILLGVVHREYTSAYPAKIIIERDRIVTENWNLPRTPGRINPDNFTPYPKNPLPANFFVNIGRADALGSGVRNLYEYTKIYSGGEPELIEGDVFKTIVPLVVSNVGLNDNTTDNEVLNDKLNDNNQLNDKLNDNGDRKAILRYLAENGEISVATAAAIIGRSHSTARRVLLQLVNEGFVEAVGANRNRKYKARHQP